MIKEKTNRENISLRPAENSDEAFLETVYADSRRGEFSALGWSREQEDAFFKMQFRMQKQSYAMQFPDALHSIVELDKMPVGRIIVYRGAAEIRLVDVALLAEFRGRGIGETLLEDLKREATFQRPLTLQVLKSNESARRFYERRSLEIVEEGDLYFSMRWRGGVN